MATVFVDMEAANVSVKLVDPGDFGVDDSVSILLPDNETSIRVYSNGQTEILTTVDNEDIEYEVNIKIFAANFGHIINA